VIEVLTGLDIKPHLGPVPDAELSDPGMAQYSSEINIRISRSRF
jgi:hypothetical protein